MYHSFVDDMASSLHSGFAVEEGKQLELHIKIIFMIIFTSDQLSIYPIDG